MAVLDAIKQARARGASDDEILSAIASQNPDKAPTIQEARKRGADAAMILSEIEKQNKPSVVQKAGKALDAYGRFVVGGVRGMAHTLLGGGEIVEKAGTAIARKMAGGKLAPELEKPGPVTEARKKLVPTDTAGKVGFQAEQVAELFVPGIAGTNKAKAAMALPKGASMLKQVAQAFKLGAIEAAEMGSLTALQTADPKATGISAGVAAIVPLAMLAVKTPLTKAAEKIYASAAKFPKTVTERAAGRGIDLVQTGLDERVFLSQGGVERVAAKIDDMERILGTHLDDAEAAGARISTAGMQSYVDEAKELFKYDVDVKAGQQAISELDDLVKNFKLEHGAYIPIAEAQKIKVKTGQQLAKYYDRLTSVGIEGRKQATRFLKEKIVEAAPKVGDVNIRLSKLYEFDKALDASTRRIKNLNLLGLGAKIIGSSGRPGMVATAGIMQILGAPLNKSGIAIGINELAKLAEASASAGRIPLQLLVRFIYDKTKNQNPNP